MGRDRGLRTMYLVVGPRTMAHAQEPCIFSLLLAILMHLTNERMFRRLALPLSDTPNGLRWNRFQTLLSACQARTIPTRPGLNSLQVPPALPIRTSNS